MFIAGGLALLALPAALADQNDAAAKFKAMDTDGDGRISPAEFTAGHQQLDASKLDTNKDGVVSDEERAAAKPAKKHWWSRSNDTKVEDPAATTQLFTKLDINSDGFLNESEFAAGLEAGK